MAEFLGTYLLVFVGTGAVIVNESTGMLRDVGVTFISALVVMVLFFALSHISGAHFNPAVTIAFLIRKDILPRVSIAYIISQVFGALFASGTLRLLFGNVANLGATTPSGSWAQSFILEFMLTFILLTVILGVIVYGKAGKGLSGLTICVTIFTLASFGGPISGASMNPARSIGPAIFSNTLQYLWIYIFATILGAVIATTVAKFLHE